MPTERTEAMDSELQQSKDPTGVLGLRCRKCGRQKFRVIYTRAAREGTIQRRRECRSCGARVTTRERALGA